MKKSLNLIPVVALGSVLALALAGCDGGGATTASTAESTTGAQASGHPAPTDVPEACAPTTGGSDGKLLIGAVSITTQGSFFGQLNEGLQEVADIAGADLQLIDGKVDPQVQADSIDNLITLGANAIIVDAWNAEALTPAIQRAVDAGIPVIGVDGTLDDPNLSTFVGISNAEGGEQLGDYLIDLSGGEGEVGEISALGSTLQLERQKAFEDVVVAGGMTIGSVVDGQNQTEDAQAAAENLLTANPELVYLYATGQPALMGAVAAARSQNVTDRVQIVGWDLSPESAQGLEDGFVKAVLQQDTYGLGQEAAKAAITVACGGTVDDLVSVPTYVVTQDNLDDYRYFLGE
jgi:ribose transport system substrate-binding protein